MAREKKSGSADLGLKSQEGVENGRQAKERMIPQSQPSQEPINIDFLQEANTLLNEIGLCQHAFRHADGSNIGSAAERLEGAILWAEALLRNSAKLVSARTAQNWGYLLLHAHTQMARQILATCLEKRL